MRFLLGMACLNYEKYALNILPQIFQLCWTVYLDSFIAVPG